MKIILLQDVKGLGKK
ncbi:MAG: hypothetical protein COX30_00460, partial [Candidatus Moranbacteria bacterium CG23_combo_of_CG06-09_8_20_14_all_39_10]